MKESSFVRQNQKKWEELESEIKQSRPDPDKISRLYVQITDDLSFAQTFYGNRSVRIYLNGVAQVLFNIIYRNNKERWENLIRFWKVDLPVIVFYTQKEFLISFLVFIAALGIGALSSAYEPDFSRQILGDSYVEMTLENIRNNDPMAVYKKSKEMDMFLGITLNNIKVAFTTFVSGIFLGLGTLISLIHNGIMVGAFQYFFEAHGLMRESFLTIWQHGTLEISSIIIAGAAGLTMSRGLLFPGTYTRMQALRLSAKRGLRIMIGIVPVFILAAFIEGFFTRHTEVPDILRLFVIIISLAFIFGYFVIYPRHMARKYPETIKVIDQIGYTDNSFPALDLIYTDGELFGITLKTLKIYAKRFFGGGLIIAVVPAFLMLFFSDFLIREGDGLLFNSHRFLSYYNYQDNSGMYFVNSILMAGCLSIASMAIHKLSREKEPGEFFGELSGRLIVNSIIIAFLINIPLFAGGGWGIFLHVLALPVLLFAVYGCFKKNIFFISGIQHAFYLVRNNAGKVIRLYLKFLFLAIILLLIIRPGFYGKYLDLIRWNLNFSEQTIAGIFNFILTLIFYYAMYLSYVMLAVSMNLLYHTSSEILFAEQLKERIDRIGTHKIIKGYEFD